MLKSVFPVLLLFLVSACTSMIRVPTADLAIRDVTVIDGNGGPALTGQTVLIEAGRVVAIAPSIRVDVPDDAQVIESTGQYLIPGLWDMHVHAWGPSPFSEIFLRHGITAIREMGTGIEPMWGGSAGVWAWREQVRSGERIGPRVFAAGFILNGGSQEEQGAPFFKGVRTPEEAQRWVDTLADKNADFIKIYSALDKEAFDALASRANEKGVRFAGHIPTRVGTRHAVTSGLASLEHLYDILISTSTEENAIRAEILDEISGAASQDINPQSAEKNRTDRLLATYSPEKADALFKLIREHGTWLTPTLLVNADPRCPGLPLPSVDEEFLSDLPVFLQRFVQLPDAAREDIELDCRRFEKLSALVGEMEKAELPLLAGSDGPNPG
ncbi:MAG: hypothetical protein HKN70_15095, partial [Gammaproteobacteria bacterium]|nr:hypothetical protein [Gammaproteobacteria bacterium]